MRERVNRIREQKGILQLELEKAADVAHSTYNGMWDRGTVTLARMEAIAGRLGVSLVELLSDQPTPHDAGLDAPRPAPARPRYLEERVEWLEAELRKLKEQLRPR